MKRVEMLSGFSLRHPYPSYFVEPSALSWGRSGSLWNFAWIF